MPTTLLGLFLFLATASPGFAFIAVASRRRPGEKHTTLRETAEWFVAGSTATLLSVLVVTGIADATNLGSVDKLLFETKGYTREHLLGLILGVAAVYVGAVLLAAAAARVIYRKHPPQKSTSAWVYAFRTMRPPNAANAVIVTTKGGEKFVGLLDEFSPDNELIECRELILKRESLLPHWNNGTGGGAARSRVVINGADVSSVEVFNVAEPAPNQPLPSAPVPLPPAPAPPAPTP